MSQSIVCKRCKKSYEELAMGATLKATGLGAQGLFDECLDSPTAKHEFVYHREEKNNDANV